MVFRPRAIRAQVRAKKHEVKDLERFQKKVRPDDFSRFPPPKLGWRAEGRRLQASQFTQRHLHRKGIESWANVDWYSRFREAVGEELQRTRKELAELKAGGKARARQGLLGRLFRRKKP